VAGDATGAATTSRLTGVQENRSLASHIRARSQNRKQIVVLGAFFDDSGTDPSQPVVAIGGLLGTEEQWDAFAAAWSELLERPLPGKPPLTQFHLTHCRAGYEEFQDYRSAERDHITYLFRQVILRTGLVTLAAAVNRIAWNELVVGDVAAKLGTPEELCFYKCVEMVINTVRFLKPGENVFMLFDQGTKARLDWWTKAYMAQSEKYPEIVGMRFAPVSKVVALQGADLIATETYQFAQEWIKNRQNPNVNPHFKEFIWRELSSGLMFDREHIEEMVGRVREGLPR
jgi:hypothetical protein